jgi:NitT/TauT family transport system ATP-binding protein
MEGHIRAQDAVPHRAAAADRSDVFLGAAPADRYHFRFEHVSKSFESRHRGEEPTIAVQNVTFGLRRGEVVSLVGPSGCGKSTLLSIGAGLNPATSGRALLDEEEIVRPRTEIAYMLQKDLLLPWRTVRGNVEFGIEIKRYSKAERRERAMALIAQCKLSGFENYYPRHISGGMRQRAALARTLAVDPELMLLDEPFSALDAQTKVVLRRDLARVLQLHNRTTLLITHDITEALSLSDRVMVMSRRPGTILREVVVDLPDRDDPLKRSLHPSVSEYVTEIWNLLQVDD